MFVLRSPAALAAATLLAASACSDPAEPLPLDGDAVVESGVLRVSGDGGPNVIAIVYSASGVDVERDGEAASFTDPVAAIEVSAGGGDDDVRFDQTVVADLELTIVAGGGDDEVVASFAPTGSGTEMTLSADVRTGAGSDSLDFRWDGSVVPALNSWITLKGETQGAVEEAPEVEDEVIVAFESGDPDRPVVLGTVWNGSGSADSSTAGGTRRLGLELDFRAGRADAAIDVSGGAGRDHFDMNADYSGVTLQQGRISLDADLNEGDNTVGQYVITSATHTYVDTRIAAGDGNNVVQLEDVLGGDGERTYLVDLGDGDNQTTIRFGDGERGRRPTTGTRNVTATYRSGAGANSVTLDSEVVEPLVSDFTIDYGAGRGDTHGRYKLKMPWDLASSPGTQLAPSQVKVLVLSPSESELDLRVDIGDPDVDEPGAFGAVTATASQVRQTDLDFLHQRASGAGTDELDDEWQLRADGFATVGDASLVVDIPPGLERIVYLQSGVEVADAATMKVALQGSAGDESVLAHLIGISGAGRYELLADGAAGSELLAVLTRDLDIADGAVMAFDLAGGDGDDVLGLRTPAEVAPRTSVTHAIAGGTGTDACFTSQDVAVTACERLEPIGDELLNLIEATFGAELADVWRQ